VGRDLRKLHRKWNLRVSPVVSNHSSLMLITYLPVYKTHF
jgi:hypothetical protein